MPNLNYPTWIYDLCFMFYVFCNNVFGETFQLQFAIVFNRFPYTKNQIKHRNSEKLAKSPLNLLKAMDVTALTCSKLK